MRPRKHETPVSMGYIMDGAWSFLNTIGFFFQTLISQEASDAFVANGGLAHSLFPRISWPDTTSF